MPTEMGKCKGYVVCKLDEVIFIVVVIVIVIVVALYKSFDKVIVAATCNRPAAKDK